jgi:hypothetical protein
MFLFLQSALVWYILKRKYNDRVYNEHSILSSMVHINDNEDDDDDSQIQINQ